MREIKFRAYDTKLKRYVDTGEIIFSFYGDTKTEVSPNEMNYGAIAEYEHDVLNGRFIVEQFTGLKDANGVDIYESDRLLCADKERELEWSTVVRYADTAFVIDVENEDYNVTALGFIDFDYTEITVIGSIHETPNLLTDKK